MTDVESLELQIKGNASGATRSLNTLIKTLEKLEKATEGGCGLSAVAKEMDKLQKANSKLRSSNTATARSFSTLGTSIIANYFSLNKVSDAISSRINESNDYVENLNLFTVAMGEYADSAMEYANTVSEALGLDPSDWIRNQGVFMTLASGFGVVGDRAATMSQQLTQLGYDIASYYNLDVAEAMNKVKSGFAGELEPLRSLGFDLSQAKLEAIALEKGITKSVNSMTQAEKAQLRYYAIMTQVTQVQGDMARTLEDPANQLRVFQAQCTLAARSLGDLFIPGLKTVLPYAIATAKVVQYLANSLAGLFGGTKTEAKDSPVADLGNSALDAADSIDETTSSVQKLKKMMLGIDELNVLPDKSSSDSDSGGWVDFELPTYDFIGEAVEGRVNEIVEQMKEWLGVTGDIDSWSEFFDTRLGNILETVGTIGAGIAAWNISVKLIEGLEKLKELFGTSFTKGTLFTGITLFLADLGKLLDFCDDFVKNGATFSNVTGILSEFAGMIGDVLIVLGQTKTGAAFKVIQGLGEIASAIGDMCENGINMENATTFVRGLSNLGITIGIATGNMALTGASMAIQGFTDIIHELSENWEAIKAGDWSGVDKSVLVVGAIEMIGGIAMALIKFKDIKGLAGIGSAASKTKEVADAATQISSTTSTMTAKLTNLAKDLGLGLLIIAEVAAAAALFVGAIWLLGKELEQVGIAWEPVLANGGTVLAALGLGTLLLVGIGAATAALGTLGGAMCGQIGIGIAVLAEIGLAAGLFIAEIWAIGVGLSKIGEAWGPVHENGDEIKEDIIWGTALLVGVGVAAAALGVATVATAGALPIAIAIGTGVLVELGGNFVKFTDSLVVVSDQLKNKLHPSLKETVKILPGLSDDMEDLTDFMGDFAGNVVKFTTSNVISGIAATVDKVVSIFTTDPIERLTDEITDQQHKMEDLVKRLNEVIPIISNAERLMDSFNSTMKDLKATTGISGNTPGSIGYTITVGVKLAKSGWSTLENWIGNLTTTLKVKLPTITVDWSKSSSDVKIPTFNARYYAQGGFPTEGELFWARENGAGPELVGTIGNRSAVVNNDQIVSAVSQGVYQAVVQAMSQSNGDQTIEAKVNDKVLFEVMVNRARQETVRRGYNPLMGGV